MAEEAAEIRANRGPCPELWLGCKIAEEAGEVVSELLAHLGMRRQNRPARVAEELRDLVSAALILGEMCGVEVEIPYRNAGSCCSPERSAVT